MKKFFLTYSREEIDERIGRTANFNGEATKLEDLDFDNAIVLDCARYDEYRRLRPNAKKRLSSASVSEEFVENNFVDGDLSDSVVVTANPHYHGIENEVEVLWKVYETNWSSKNRKVRSDVLADRARSAKRLFPDKKLVVHFMDPHQTFVDENGEPVFSSDANYNLAQAGLVSNKKIKEYYRESLRYVLDIVVELAEDLEGKTIITSDHGEFLGEENLYGHYSDNKSKYLREVPLEKFHR